MVGTSTKPQSREKDSPRNFLLGDRIIQPQLNRLLIGKWVRKLEPRCMDLLVFFAHHPLEVHSRERLIDEVWIMEAVATTTLTHAIAQIRQALGDDARRPRYIETIHRRGYRLVIEPEEVPDEDLVSMGDLTRRLNDCGSRDVLTFDNRRVSAIHETRDSRNGHRFGVVSSPLRSATQEDDTDRPPDELVLRIAIRLPKWIRPRLRRRGRSEPI